MRSKETVGPVVIVALIAGLAVWPVTLRAQIKGDNAVYSSTSALINSGSFIDASVFAGSGTDLCSAIYAALSTAPTTGAVIDARGINSSNSSLNCTSGTPWVQSTTVFSNTPATVLLPAGIISIHSTWVLPNGTKLVGVGSGISGTGSAAPGITTIQEATGFTGNMIQMGPNNGTPVTLTPCSTYTTTSCMGISVEDLTLDGNNLASVGIINGQAREESYVRGVYLYRIPGIGLQVWNAANFSGPYSNITFSNTTSAASSTVCVWIDNVSTRGVHGLNCTTANGTTTPAAAVILDGDGNSIEDVQIQGFSDGILVGKDNPTQSNVLLNIAGATGVANVIHICGSYSAGTCPSTPNAVSDLSIMSVATGGSGGASYSIEDDVSLESTAQTTKLSDANVAMYVVGEPVKAGGSAVGYSRFSTSPSIPTWVVETSTSSSPPSPCIPGSLLSNTTGTAGKTLWVCTGGTWTDVE